MNLNIISRAADRCFQYACVYLFYMIFSKGSFARQQLIISAMQYHLVTLLPYKRRRKFITRCQIFVIFVTLARVLRPSAISVTIKFCSFANFCNVSRFLTYKTESIVFWWPHMLHYHCIKKRVVYIYISLVFLTMNISTAF